MTDLDSQAYEARWRRLDRSVAEVASAMNWADPNRCPDSIATALDALYDLWELWTSRKSLTLAEADDAVRGSVNGETAAALVHARGGKTHSHVEFGDFTDTVAAAVYDHFGCWRWQPYADVRPRFAERGAWYEAHVATHEVLPPFDAALQWMQQVIARRSD